MATIVNNPGEARSSDNGNGFIVGIILIIIAMVLFFYYGLPALRSGFGTAGTQVNVPDHVNVNVQHPNGQ